MSNFVRDHVGDPQQFRLGGSRFVDQQQYFPVGDAAEVLHRPEREVRHRHHVEFLPGIRNVVILREEPQRERTGFERVVSQVALANRVDNP